MTERPPANAIDEAASRWAVRVDAGALDAGQRRALEAWLAADPRHQGAYARARAGLRWLDQGRVVRTVVPLPDDAPPPVASASLRRRAGLWGAAAAGIAAAAALWVARPGGDSYATGVGEQRRVTLADGSVAMINTDSDVAVAYRPARRTIDLARGEAWFQVAKDRQRPFVVQAGPVRVRATGTAFSVRRIGAGAQVVVTEGRVLAWVQGEGAPPVAVRAGEQAFVRPQAPAAPVARAVRAEDVLAWRKGEIVLSGQTVAAAAAEFNRYNAVKIRVADPVIGQRKVVGYFLIDQSLPFARAAARANGGHVTQNGHDIVIEK